MGRLSIIETDAEEPRLRIVRGEGLSAWREEALDPLPSR
jgi:hypothetical protein